MEEVTNWDRFFIYIILPFLAILPFFGTKYYFNNKQPYYQQIKQFKQKYILTLNLIVGNLGAGLIINGIAILLYLYILNLSLFTNLRWEIITIFAISIFSYLIGIGFGSHVTAITIKTHLDSGTFEKNERIARVINFFHYPFSHKCIYAGILMTLYVLCLLDIFKGKSLPLTNIEALLAISTGIVGGTVCGILAIITKSQTFVLKVSIICIISLYFVLLNESLNVWGHPLALMIVTMFITLILGIALQKQTKINLRTPIKQAVKYWLNWDIDQI